MSLAVPRISAGHPSATFSPIAQKKKAVRGFLHSYPLSKPMWHMASTKWESTGALGGQLMAFPSAAAGRKMLS